MALTGYLGENLWNGYTNIVTQISSDRNNMYSQRYSTAPADINKVIKLEHDVYPTGITFDGYVSNYSRNIGESMTLSLCDKDGNNVHDLGRVEMGAAVYHENQSSDKDGNPVWVGSWFEDYKPASKFNSTGHSDWTDLAGATLAIKKTGGNDTYIGHVYKPITTVIIYTNYTTHRATVQCNEGGTITINNKSYADLGRNITANVVVTPNKGYKLVGTPVISVGDGVTVNTSATISKAGDNTFTFKMSSPAVPTTITATFEKSEFKITKSVNIKDAGTITVEGTTEYGQIIKIKQESSNINEYRFASWNIQANDQLVTLNESEEGWDGQFVMPAADVTVVANYLQHEITWKNASLKAFQEPGSEYIQLTYSGIATDNFDTPMEYWVYREDTPIRQLRPIGDGNETDEIPSATEKTVIVIVNEEDVNKELHYSIVAKNTIISVAKTVGLNIKDLHKTIGYFHDGEWKQCIPYYFHDGEWHEVEPYYFHDGEWTLCSVV